MNGPGLQPACFPRSRVHWRFGVGAGILLFLEIALAAPSQAQSEPSEPQAQGETASTAPQPTAATTPQGQPGTAGALEAQLTCQRPASVAALVNNTTVVRIEDETRWQPLGGEILVTVQSSIGNLANTTSLVCFAWQTADGSAGKDVEFLVASPSIRVVKAEGPTTQIAVTIPESLAPDGGPFKREGFSLYAGVAQVRVLLAGAGFDPPLDVWLKMGVTSPIHATLLAVMVIVATIFALYLVGRTIHILSGAPPGAKPWPFPLSIIATESGFASLSQFQIVLWTLVVAWSAAYVMALAGALIPISTGTLALLGISGAAALGARIQSLAEHERNPAPPRAAGATLRTPQLADLVRDRGQIDVTKVQMLLFTVISAAFVLLKVMTTFRIPEIPESYLLLMGISNGIYLANKFVPPERPAAGPPPPPPAPPPG